MISDEFIGKAPRILIKIAESCISSATEEELNACKAIENDFIRGLITPSEAIEKFERLEGEETVLDELNTAQKKKQIQFVTKIRTGSIENIRQTSKFGKVLIE